MSTETLIDSTFTLDSLSRPETALSYNVDRLLAQAFPDSHCLSTNGSTFDVEEFACDGHCRIRLQQSPHPQLLTEWRGKEYALEHTLANVWLEVEWENERYSVVIMHWPRGDYREDEQTWVIGRNREVTEQFFFAVCAWCSEVRGEVLVYAEGCWSKNKQLYDAIKSSTLENLILQGNLKQEITSDFEQFFETRHTYEQYGVPWKRGVLFLGPPGNGKTHAVKALINHLNYPCLYVKSFKARYGSDYGCIHGVFDRARKTTPCILVLEDLDSLLDDKNRSLFLNELDGFAANTGIVTLATTNHPERLDPAILDRPSRFDRKYHFDLPAATERARYLALWNHSLESEVRLTESGIDEISQKTEGFSFAYLKELVLSGLMSWIHTPGRRMDEVVNAHVAPLREQMTSAPEEPMPALLGDGSEEDEEQED